MYLGDESVTEDINRVQSGAFEKVANRLDIGLDLDRKSSFQECSAEQNKGNISKDMVFCRSTSE